VRFSGITAEDSLLYHSKKKVGPMANRNIKKYPKQVTVPLTAEQYDRLYTNWLNNGAPVIVDQIRRAIDEYFGTPAGSRTENKE
jgi:hypothetical protein